MPGFNELATEVETEKVLDKLSPMPGESVDVNFEWTFTATLEVMQHIQTLQFCPDYASTLR